MLEALPAFLGAADEQVAKEAWKLFAKQGLAIELGIKIRRGHREQERRPSSTPMREGKAKSAAFDKLIVSIGRVPQHRGARRRERSV